jgi:hypothetical protein
MSRLLLTALAQDFVTMETLRQWLTIGSIADCVDERDCRGPLYRRLGQTACDPGQEDCGAGVEGAGEEHHCHV